MKDRLHWEDFVVGTRLDFGATEVSRDAMLDFARQFDPQPFHVDEIAARDSLFGGLCASGWHTCALAMRMMCEAYLLDTASLGSPGIDQLRWVKPVFPGDTLHMRMQVKASRPTASRPAVGLVLFEWTVFNQHDEPVLTMEGWGMIGRRLPGSPDQPAAAGPR